MELLFRQSIKTKIALIATVKVGRGKEKRGGGKGKQKVGEKGRGKEKKRRGKMEKGERGKGKR